MDVIESCLDSDPDRRPTGRELVSLLTQIASNDSYSGDSSQARRRIHAEQDRDRCRHSAKRGHRIDGLRTNRRGRHSGT